MSRMLIEEFKEQHKAILALFNVVYEEGVTTPKARQALAQSKKLLFAHLKKEDEEFYPAMREAAKGNKSLAALLEVFSSDMEQLTGGVIELFDQFDAAGASVSKEIALTFGKFMARLKARITNEEVALYPEYERLKL